MFCLFCPNLCKLFKFGNWMLKFWSYIWVPTILLADPLKNSKFDLAHLVSLSLPYFTSFSKGKYHPHVAVTQTAHLRLTGVSTADRWTGNTRVHCEVLDDRGRNKSSPDLATSRSAFCCPLLALDKLYSLQVSIIQIYILISSYHYNSFVSYFACCAGL